MSYSSNYTITTLSASVEQYGVEIAGSRAPLIPQGRIRQPECPTTPYIAINGNSKKFPFGRLCYSGGWVCGKIGNYALRFNGVASYVSVGNVSDFAWMHGKGNITGFQWSVSFWMKMNSLPSGLGAEKSILSSNTANDTGAGFSIFFDDSGGRALTLNSRITDSSNNKICQLLSDVDAYPDDLNWHHVVVTYDQNADNSPLNMALWLDNDRIKTAAVDEAEEPTDGNSANALTIGATTGGEALPFPGVLDDVAIWNKVVGAAEITELYNRGIGLRANAVQTSNLVSYWNMEQGPGYSEFLKNDSSAISGSVVATVKSIDDGTAC